MPQRVEKIDWNQFEPVDEKDTHGTNWDNFEPVDNTDWDQFQPVSTDRSWADAAKDTALQFGVGSGNIIKNVGDVGQMITGDRNTLQTLGKETSAFYEPKLSDAYQASKSLQRQEIDSTQGEGGKFWATVETSLSDPKLIAGFLTEQLPQLVVGGAAGRIVGGAATLMGAGAAAAGTAATAGMIGSEALMQGGDIGGDTYSKLMALDQGLWDNNPRYQELIAQGETQDQAKHSLSIGMARTAAGVAGAITVGTNFIPGGATLERALVGATKEGIEGGVKSAVKGGVGAFIGEGIGEGIEEGSGQIANNFQVNKIDPNQGLTEGVGEAAAQGALVGGIMGGAAGTVEGSQNTQQPKKDPATATMQELVEEHKATLQAAQAFDKTADNLETAFDIGFTREHKPSEEVGNKQNENQPIAEPINPQTQTVSTTNKPLSDQAQRVKDASEIPVGGSEDDTAQAVRNTFVKQPDSVLRKMSATDRAAYENNFKEAQQFGEVDDSGNPMDDFGSPLFSKEQKPQQYNSVLEDAIESMPNRMPVESFNAYLKKRGVKDDEIKYSGLMDAMEGKDTIHKDEASQAITRPALEKKVLSHSGIEEESNRQFGVDFAQLTNPRDRQLVLDKFPDTPRYEKYSTQGVGTNYREELTTLQDRVNTEKWASDTHGNRVARANTIEELYEHLGARTPENKAKVDDMIDRGDLTINSYTPSANTQYKSSHWDQANVLYHTRKQDTKIDGDHTLLVEEIQSDWHQDGRKKGYKNPIEDEHREIGHKQSELDIKLDKIRKEITDIISQDNYSKEEADAKTLEFKTNREEYSKLQERRDEIVKELDNKFSGSQIPQAPYSKTWHEKAMKDIIAEAVADGYARVAWVSGKTSADRYSLSKQVDNINYSKNDDGSYHIYAIKDGGTVFNERSISENKLADSFGKEVAEKIIKDEGVKVDGKKGKRLEGENLEVGGEGMKGFYDKILPDFTNKYIKKYGSKLETKTLSNGDKVWSFPVTEQMKADVSGKGQTLYSKGDKSGTTVSRVESIARKTLGTQFAKIKDGLKIVQSVNDLPLGLRVAVLSSMEAETRLTAHDGRNFNYDDTTARERFDIPKLELISKGGSDRQVFDLGDGKVLKVAKTARGIKQNEAGNDWHLSGRIIPKIFESGKNYLVTEKVNFTEKRKEINALTKFLSSKNVRRNNRIDGGLVYEALQEAEEKFGVDGLTDLADYDLLWNDITAARNWGIGVDGRIVLADEGSVSADVLNVSNEDKSYWEGIKREIKQLKKQFGDTDKYMASRAEPIQKGGKVKGVFDPKTGTAYVIADSVSEKEAAGVILHELLHKAINTIQAKKSEGGKKVTRLEAILGSNMAPLVQRLEKLNELGDAQVRKAYRYAKNAGTDARNMNEEVMAYLLENITNEARPMLKKFMDDLRKAIRDFLARVAASLNLDPKWFVNQINARDIADLLRAYALDINPNATSPDNALMSKMDRLTEWHKDSHPLTKNEDGTPKVLFHGTPTKGITEFDLEAVALNRGDDAKGVYFTADKDYAYSYASQKIAPGKYQRGEVINAYLNIKNPLDITDAINKRKKGVSFGDAKRAALLKLDRSTHDGVIYLGQGRGQDEFIVFSPNQIKSTDNRGTFDESDANTLHSKDQDENSGEDNTEARRSVIKALHDHYSKTAVERAREVLTAAKDENYGKFKSWFKDTLPQQYVDSVSEMIKSKSKIHQEVGIMQAALSNLTIAQREEIHEYLGGDRDTVSEDLKPIADRARNMIDSLSRRLVAQGVLKSDMVDAWEGKYIHRSYKKYLDGVVSQFKSIIFNNKKTLSKQFERGLSEEIDNNKDGIKFINRYLESFGHQEVTASTISAAMKQLEKRGLLAKDDPMWKSNGQIKITEKNGKYTMVRDYSATDRTRMEEVKDAALTVPDTIMRLGVLLEHGKLLNRVSDGVGEGMIFDSFEEVEAAGFDYHNFATIDNRPQYGMMAGKVVRNDIHNDITGNMNDMIERNGIFDMWLKSLSLWKKSKTVWNPIAHFNNFTSNLFIKYGMGINPLNHTFKSGSMLHALGELHDLEVKDRQGTLTKTEADRFASLKEKIAPAIELRDLGMLGSTQLVDIKRGFEQNGVEEESKNMAVRAVKALDKFSEDMYQGGDTINRLAAYLGLLEKGISKKDAISMIEKLFPDYSKPLPMFWKWSRDLGISPFISWSYYTLPAIYKITKANPERAASAYAVLGAIAFIGLAMSSDDQDDAVAAFFGMPEESLGRRMPVFNDDGEIITWKVDRLIPGIDLASPLIGAAAGAVQGSKESDGYWLHTGVKAIGGAMVGAGNAIRNNFAGPTINALIFNTQGSDSYTMKPIVDPKASDKKRMYLTTKYYIEQYAPIPTPLVRIYEIAEGKILSKDERQRNSSVIPRNAWENAAGFAGINVLRFDLKELEKQRHDFSAEAQEFTSFKQKADKIDGFVKDAQKRQDGDKVKQIVEAHKEDLPMIGDMKETSKALNKLKGQREEARLNGNDEAVLQLNEAITKIMGDFNKRHIK